METGNIFHDSNITIPNMTLTLVEYNIDRESEIRSSHGISLGLILKTTTVGVILITASLGNLALLVRIIRDPGLHRPPFYYVISLSVSDLCRAIVCLPFVMASALHGSVWRHGDIACTIIGFANTFFLFSSVAALFSIAMDRHLSVVFSHFHRRRSRGLLPACVILSGWLISFAVSFPPMFRPGSYAFISEESQCTYKHRKYRENDSLGFLLVLSAIMIGTMVLYGRIFIFLRKHRRMRPIEYMPSRSNNWTFHGLNGNGILQINIINGLPMAPPLPTVTHNLSQVSGTLNDSRGHQNEHLTRVFFIMTIVFDLLWIFHIIQSYVIIFRGDNDISALFRCISAWFSYIQVSLCPAVVFGFSVRGAFASNVEEIPEISEMRY